MLRLPLFASLCLACAPAALFAAPAEIPATLSAVTLFPEGAQVTRTIAVPAGATEVLVPNLPDGTDAASLRVAGEGVEIGAVTLMADREPAARGEASPEVKAARADLEAATKALAEAKDKVATLKAKVTAAEAQAEFLRSLDTSNTPPEKIAMLAQSVAEGVLAAEQARVAARAEVRAADAALKPQKEAVERAKQALEALEHPAKASDALVMTVSGAGTVTVTTFVEAAGWSPSYDARLDSAAGKLALDRFVSVHQASGEDWRGVKLVLSTARPSERTDPSEMWSDLRRIGPPEPPMVGMAAPKAAMDSYAAPVMEAAPAPVASRMTMEMQGETVIYSYPTAVDIRDGVEDLRLKLDRIEEPVTVRAEAVPMFDETAYRVVEGKTAGVEPILPGPAVLWLDGAVVGAVELPLIAAGDKLHLGYGAIDGLRLKRVIPQANEGDRGLITKSNERTETAQITIENLTDKAWSLRVIDRVPYAEQEDLQITHTATPAETTADYDDKRGVLAWDLDLAAGAKQVITLDTTMRWPADQVLQ
ncbi:uncharacterized protein (TIGR02231 family) [Rhodobacter viridis]|uniref:Uncharacterized protein (TIGR02231 family) n=1 Tax=Rhodobacter viridis TaxID=1054202 RepID=A0A318TZA5_9RHOB|nr:DUF4139 domain-containing protein [Rhodobacter viridis]PYF09718.1 uncharacterized protein (TIGR02231 family) [Rhodobacter viridis]